MAKKNCPSLAVGLLIALFAPPVYSPEAVTPFESASRISDTVTASPRQHTDILTAAPASTDFALQADIVPLAYDFDSGALDELASRGSLRLAHPEGGELQVTLISVTTHQRTRTLQVVADGYPGTITQRGASFFATLATERGVYAIEHRQGATALVDQRQLDLRNTQKDFAHVPAT
jgi:hypothetical protein